MICFIIGTIEEPAYTFHDRAPSMSDGRRTIGMQTPIAGPKRGPIIQGGISSPFFTVPPQISAAAARSAGAKSAEARAPCDHSAEHGRCILKHGHEGCHVISPRKTSDQEARP